MSVGILHLHFERMNRLGAYLVCNPGEVR